MVIFGQHRVPGIEIGDYFRHKQQLLVLDNFEHLLDGADLLTALLEAAPGVKLLVTSRERLNLSSETVFALGGMALPDLTTPDDALHADAVQLFLQGARRIRRDFKLQGGDLTDLAWIHHPVGGMPLGLLLAASWVDTFTLPEIAQEIEHSLDFLASEWRDVPDRHRSLRAVFDSSWQQLGEAERAIFRRLSVFRGGFTREAAWQVAGADLRALARLINKSLLRRDPTTARYEMHERLRQYAADQLQEAGEAAATHDRHCAYYAEFVCQHTFEFWGDGPRMATADVDNYLAAWARGQARSLEDVAEDLLRDWEKLG